MINQFPDTEEEKKTYLKSFMGFLYHFERQIIKNNKRSSAWVEVITTCNRTQRVPSGCLSTVNCRCNGAERRPCVSSGSSHFLVPVCPAGLRRRSCIAISRRSSSLFSVAQPSTDFPNRKLRLCNFLQRPCGVWVSEASTGLNALATKLLHPHLKCPLLRFLAIGKWKQQRPSVNIPCTGCRIRRSRKHHLSSSSLTGAPAHGRQRRIGRWHFSPEPRC